MKNYHSILKIYHIWTSTKKVTDPKFRHLYHQSPQTSSATSLTSLSFSHCSASVRMFPSSVEANPHCGLMHNLSFGTYLEASSMRALISSLSSSSGYLDENSPSTTNLSSLTLASDSKPPARSVSYSR